MNRNEYLREWAKRNPDKIKSYNLKQNAKIEKRIHSRVKSRAKKYNIPFDIDVEDIIVPEYCPVLGIKIVHHLGEGKGYRPDCPSIDKIIPRLGYIKGNVRVISARANLLKNDATVDELERVLNNLKRLHNERLYF